MKKLALILACLMLGTAVLTACGDKKEPEQDIATETGDNEESSDNGKTENKPTEVYADSSFSADKKTYINDSMGVEFTLSKGLTFVTKAGYDMAAENTSTGASVALKIEDKLPEGIAGEMADKEIREILFEDIYAFLATAEKPAKRPNAEDTRANPYTYKTSIGTKTFYAMDYVTGTEGAYVYSYSFECVDGERVISIDINASSERDRDNVLAMFKGVYKNEELGLRFTLGKNMVFVNNTSADMFVQNEETGATVTLVTIPGNGKDGIQMKKEFFGSILPSLGLTDEQIAALTEQTVNVGTKAAFTGYVFEEVGAVYTNYQGVYAKKYGDDLVAIYVYAGSTTEIDQVIAMFGDLEK